jgi:hypothetical protein
VGYSLLQAVNRVLKRTGDIAGDAGDLTSFTDSARQTTVDVVLQVWGEVIHELYSLGALVGEVEEDLITLVADQNDYDLPNDFEAIAGKTYRSRCLVNADNNNRLYEYPGGFDQLFSDQPDPTNFTGQPRHFVFNPIVNEFRIDTMPTSEEAGDEYKYLFEKRISLTKTADKFPFSDTVVDGLVPVVAEITVNVRNKKAVDPLSANAGFNRALATIMQKKKRTAYGTWRRQRLVRHHPFSFFDHFGH